MGAMAAEAAERQLGLLRDEREAELAQSRCGTHGTRHRPSGGGYGEVAAGGAQRDPLLVPAVTHEIIPCPLWECCWSLTFLTSPPR